MSNTTRDEITHPDRAPTVWLDHLPIEVCARISSMLPRIEYERDPRIGRYKRRPPAITLATVSSFQKRAVAFAQNAALHIERANDIRHTVHLITAWQDILGDHIDQICLPLNIDYDPNELISHALARPSILKATIPNCPPLFEALITGAAVKQLQISLTCYCFEDRQSAIHLSDVLRACPVERLLLTCDTCIRFLGTKCLAVTILEALSVGSTCDSVRSLEVACYSKEIVHALDGALLLFPNLENLRLEHRFDITVQHVDIEAQARFSFAFSPAFKQRLQSLKHVGIMNCGPIDRFVPVLGSKLVTITCQTPVSREAIGKLEQCPNLETVDLILENGAEESFPNTLSSLRSVSLTWRKQNLSAVEGSSPPKSEFFIRLVRCNKHLEALSLQNAKIMPDALEHMLRTVGERLRRLVLSISGNDESPKDRTLRVVRLIVMYNRNLSELAFGVAPLPLPCHRTRCPQHADEDDDAEDIIKCDACAQMRFLDMVWVLAERNLPRISTDSIVQLIGALGMYDIFPACPVQ